MALTEKYVSSLAAGGGTGNSEGSAYTFDEMKTLINAGTAAGYRFNIKADGTYTRSSTDTFSGSGTVGSPIVLRGYKTVIGDGYLGRTNQGALITTNMPLVSIRGTNISGNYFIFESINFLEVVSDGFLFFGSYNSAINCNFLNNAGGSSAYSMYMYGTKTTVSNCDLKTVGSHSNSLVIQSYNTFQHLVNGCRIISESNAFPLLFNGSGNSIDCINNVFINGSIALSLLNASIYQIIGNTFYNQTTASIYETNTSIAAPNRIMGNNFVDCARPIYNPYNATAAHPILDINNYYNNNTNPNLGFGDWPSFNTVTGTGGGTADFISPSTGDFRLKNSSGAADKGINGADLGGIPRLHSLNLVGCKIK